MRSTRKSRHVIVAAVGAAALVGGLSGCGGDANASEHDVIKVMTWAPEEGSAGSAAGMPALATAIAKQVNDTGGLQGHQLQVVTCDEQNTPVGAAACATEAANQKVAAVVGSYSQFAGTFMPILETAGIPYIGGFGLSPQEFTSPYSYPVNGGYQALLAGNGEQLAESGCHRVAVIRPQSKGGDTMLGFLNAGLSTKQITAVDIPVDQGRTDYTTEAGRAIGADLPHSCVTTALDPASTATFYDDYRRLSPTNTQLSAIIGSFQQSLVDSTGGDTGPLRSALATGWYPPDDSPVWNALHAAVKQYAFTDNRINTADPGEQTTWIAFEVLRKAVSEVNGPVTGSALKAALDASAPINTGGQTPPLSWRDSDLLPLASAPRLVNTKVTFQQVRVGALTEEKTGLVDVRSILLQP
ncbi:ABC-type branched-subunit amino acid transport system substrate-binding protein [Streptacidiphilus sp. MAP12-16]|uniref:ABC transporter substrate-binding protein n=1 Tax=Streptacidiphilus sp. MAP12-16 TaxID=3156300 RepID=UPI0035163429